MADDPKQEIIGAGPAAPEGVLGTTPTTEQSKSEFRDYFNKVSMVSPIPFHAAGMGMMGGQIAATTAARGMARIAPYVSKMPERILRIIMGSVGSGVGAELEGESPAMGAVTGAIGGAAGEALGAAGTFLSRRAGMTQSPAAKAAAFTAAEKERVTTQTAAEKARMTAARQSEADRIRTEKAGVKQQIAGANAAEQQRVASQSGQVSQELGDVMGSIAPPLQPTLGPTSAQQLSTQGIFSRDVRRDLGKWQQTRLEEAEGLSGGPETTLRVPSLVPAPKLSPEEATLMKRLKIDPAKASLVNAGRDEVTLRDATEQLSDIGQGVWRSGDGTTVKLSKLEQARQYGKVRNEIMDGLTERSPEAAARWDEGRYGFSTGNAMMTMLRKEGVFDRSPDAVQLDLKGLQQMFRKNAQWLKDRLHLREDYQRLESTIMRGKDITTEVAAPSVYSMKNLPPGVSLPTAARRPVAQPVAPAQPAPPRPIFTPNDYAQIYLNSMLERRLHPDR